MVYFGGEARCAQWIKADVLVEVERESIGADRTMEGDKHLSLLSVADALHCPD